MKRTRQRIRNKHPQPPQDGPLQLARNQLEDAIHNLTAPQHHPDGPLNSRYKQLRDAISSPGMSGHHQNQPGSIIPAWIDALMLTIKIDSRTAQWDTAETTPQRLNNTLNHHRRPQDVSYMQTITAEIQAWTIAIDDLFAPAPLFLPDPCPQCRHHHAYRVADDGERIKTPALTITIARGASCAQCHATWPPDQLVFLGRVLGYRTEGITA